jgi:TolB-like protein/Tfp pilus assembly protein PilF
MSLIAELKRRNVFRVGIAYAVGAWLLLQVADILLEAFAAPDWTLRLVVVLLIIGLPVALFFAWAFELTPEGIKRESEVDRSTSITHQTGRRLDRAIIAVLVLALGYFAVDKFVMRPGAMTEAPDVAAEPGPGADAPASPAPALPTDKSIAVLPFDHRSSREEDRFFTTGIHDDLLTQLAQISELRVISRTSVAQFENTEKSIRDIAELLNVATILEGGVQRAGDQVRINLQLIDAATDAHLWAKTYDRELTASNVFAIQSEIATAVAAAMRATLTPEDRERISNVPTENMAALEEYFKARAEMDTRSVPSIESARLRFQAARELDPGFALAYAGEAQAILLLADDGNSYGDIPVTEAVALARPLLETAYELAPGEPKVLATYGLLENTADQLEAANDWFDRALAITPDDGEVLNWKRLNLGDLGRMQESLAVNERMIEADPYSQVTLFNGAATLSYVGDGSPEKVDRLLDRLEELNPGLAWTTRGLVAETRGQSPEAAQHYFRAITLDPGAARARERLGNLLARLGLEDEALNVDPEAEEYLPFFRKDHDALVEQARRDVADTDGGTEETLFLISDLVTAGQDEEALELAEQLWRLLGESSDQLRFHSMNMAIAARRSERPLEEQRYRDAFAKFVQKSIENDIQFRFRYFNEATLAAFDGRDDDALAAMTRSIDRGLRWTGFFDLAAFDELRTSLAFQTELARMEELATADRYRILSDLCAPDAAVTDWTPAPESCALWRERDTAAAAPI